MAALADKTKEIISRYQELQKLLSSPDAAKDHAKFKALMIEQKELGDSYEKCAEYEKLIIDINQTKELLKNETDAQSITFYQEYLQELLSKQTVLETELISLLTPKDPDDNRNVIVEIRAGTGGEEAALFAADLYRMYLRYCEQKSWQTEQYSASYSANGGYKEVIFGITGKKVYGTLKFENGVHRVQRVPATEAAGRIHTSAASVVVLPEVQDLNIEIKDTDLRIDVYRSSGPGGQSVNTTDSAVRITHLPSGIVVSCQDEKSQLKNKQRALVILKSRLYDLEMEKKQQELSSERKASIRGGDRSVKIKTYNYPQNRLTDHRIKQTWYNLDSIMNGELEEILTTTKEKFTQL